MNYIPTNKSQINFSINWADLLVKLHKLDIDGVKELGEGVLNIFSELEALSQERELNGKAVGDCIDAMKSRVELLFDAISDLAIDMRNQGNTELQAIYSELSDLMMTLEYGLYGAMWSGLNLCDQEKPKDPEVSKMLHSFKTCNYRGGALLKHFQDACEYLGMPDLAMSIGEYRKIEKDERTANDYQVFLEDVYQSITSVILKLTSDGHLEQADLLMGFALSVLSETVFYQKQYYNLINCDRIKADAKDLAPVRRADIAQPHVKEKMELSPNDHKLIDDFWKRIEKEKASEPQLAQVEAVNTQELGSKSQVINSLWLRLQNTFSYIDLFRSQAQRQEVNTLKLEMHQVLSDDYIPNHDKAMSLERLLSRFVADEHVSARGLNQEVLYLGASIIGELV